MCDRNTPFKFGPEWLRNLPGRACTTSTSNQSVATTVGSSVTCARNNSQQISNTVANPYNLTQSSSRVFLDKLREEMLALYDRNATPPPELKTFDLLNQVRGQPLFALNTLEEMRDNTRSAPPAEMAPGDRCDRRRRPRKTNAGIKKRNKNRRNSFCSNNNEQRSTDTNRNNRRDNTDYGGPSSNAHSRCTRTNSRDLGAESRCGPKIHKNLSLKIFDAKNTHQKKFTDHDLAQLVAPVSTSNSEDQNKFKECSIFHKQMRLDFNIEGEGDENGTFQSVILPRNNSLIKKHQNIHASVTEEPQSSNLQGFQCESFELSNKDAIKPISPDNSMKYPDMQPMVMQSNMAGSSGFQGNSNTLNMPNTDGNNSLFFNQNNNVMNNPIDLQIANQLGQNMYSMHGMQQSNPQAASVYNTMMQHTQENVSQTSPNWFNPSQNGGPMKKTNQVPSSSWQSYDWFLAGFFSASMVNRRACELGLCPVGIHESMISFEQMGMIDPFLMPGWQQQALRAHNYSNIPSGLENQDLINTPFRMPGLEQPILSAQNNLNTASGLGNQDLINTPFRMPGLEQPALGAQNNLNTASGLVNQDLINTPFRMLGLEQPILRAQNNLNTASGLGNQDLINTPFRMPGLEQLILRAQNNLNTASGLGNQDLINTPFRMPGLEQPALGAQNNLNTASGLVNQDLINTPFRMPGLEQPALGAQNNLNTASGLVNQDLINTPFRMPGLEQPALGAQNNLNTASGLVNQDLINTPFRMPGLEQPALGAQNNLNTASGLVNQDLINTPFRMPGLEQPALGAQNNLNTPSGVENNMESLLDQPGLLTDHLGMHQAMNNNEINVNNLLSDFWENQFPK